MNVKALHEIQSIQWALAPDTLTALIQALSGDVGQRVEGTQRAYKNDSVGVVDIVGPTVSRSSWLSRFFGLMSIEDISADLRKLEADEEIDHIVIAADTPGGSVAGTGDLSSQIAAIGKPTTIFVNGMLASAGYWWGSAADRIVASETALIGALGVVTTATAWETPGEITVVSSQTPKKNQSPGTKEGLEALQKIVDDLAAVFMADVAQNRRISIDQVEARFGEGGIFIAKEALGRGMIDEISTFQSLMDSLKTAPSGGEKKGFKMDLKTLQKEHGDVFAEAVKIGMETERKRVEAHLVMGEASGDMETATKAIKDGSEMDALLTAKYQAAGMLKAQMMARVADNPELEVPVAPPAAGKQSEEDTVAQLVADGLSFYSEGGVS